MKEVVGFPNYRITDDGEVWCPTGKMKPRIDPKGYPMVNLWRDGKRYTRRVHQLVAQAYIGPPPPKQEVCHRDGVKANNHISNLVYGTRRENILDNVRFRTHVNARKTHCKRGHEFTPENTYHQKNGARQCKQCHAIHMADYKQRQREKEV